MQQAKIPADQPPPQLLEILERLIPGLSIAGPVLSSFLGFNIFQYLYSTVILSILGFFTSSITISGKEVLHDEVLKWLTENVTDAPGVLTTGARRLTAAKSKAWDRLESSSKKKGNPADITPRKYSLGLINIRTPVRFHRTRG